MVYLCQILVTAVFFPSRNDIYNIMYTASIQMRHSKIDQEELAHKIAEWRQESPQDKFFLRPIWP